MPPADTIVARQAGSAELLRGLDQSLHRLLACATRARRGREQAAGALRSPSRRAASRPLDCAASRASVTAASPGSTPQRPCPTFRSTSTPMRHAGRRAPRATALRARPANRPPTVRRTRLASAATRAHFPRVTISLASRHVVAEARSHLGFGHRRARQAAARTGGQLARAISGVLCALKCGRSRQEPSAKNAAMRAMLRSSAATSTIERRRRNVVDLAGTLRDILVIPASGRHDAERPHLPYRLLRSTPSTSAVRDMLPCCAASARRMYCFSNSSRASCSGAIAAARLAGGGVVLDAMLQETEIARRHASPGTMIISRSTRLRSSRTLPGHG